MDNRTQMLMIHYNSYSHFLFVVNFSAFLCVKKK